MLRLHLPPNLTAAAARDAIPVKLDLDLTAEPAPALFPALALLQRWCGTATPPKFLQLSRAQLRELATALGSQPVFVENGQTVAFRHADIVAAPAAATSSPATRSASPRAARRMDSDLTPMTVDGSEHFLAITLPSREAPFHSAVVELLKTSGFVLETSNRKWWLRDRHKVLNFLGEHLSRLRDVWLAEFTPNFEKNTAKLATTSIAAEVVEQSGEFQLTLGVRAGSASEEAIRTAVTSNRGYVESDGKIFLLDRAKLQQLQAAQQALAGSLTAGPATRRTHRISRARLAEAEEILETLAPGFQPPEAWRRRTEALRQTSRLAPAPVPEPMQKLLRSYQRLGAAWLWHLHRQELGGILADEMGLGKTLQAIALLSAVHRENRAGTSLVVCPASLLENWRRELARFAPDLRVFVHHGARRLTARSQFSEYDVVLTSYGTLTRDWELFSGAEFAVAIADEAQHIKNRRSQNAASLRSMRARSRFLLTGTPVENSLQDLRSLFEFLLPGYIGKVPPGLRTDERQWHDDRLRAKVAPYILRRTKRAVAPELPEKLEQVMWCELGDEQAALYRETQQRTERELFDLGASGASEAQLRFAALTQLLRLRQICCDPRLVLKGSGANAKIPSAKLEAFRELLAEAVDDGHRVLVFSQFTALLGLLRAELQAEEIAHCYLDGSMAPRARQAEVDRFQASPEIGVFLISLKAGGTGLNLTGADTVVHFDPWWNPAAEAQATDRAHRIGQTRVVTSYKLIASNTVEEKVLALQDEKRALLADVFEASDASAAKLSLADLRTLLS